MWLSQGSSRRTPQPHRSYKTQALSILVQNFSAYGIPNPRFLTLIPGNFDRYTAERNVAVFCIGWKIIFSRGSSPVVTFPSAVWRHRCVVDTCCLRRRRYINNRDIVLLRCLLLSPFICHRTLGRPQGSLDQTSYESKFNSNSKLKIYTLFLIKATYNSSWWWKQLFFHYWTTAVAEQDTMVTKWGGWKCISGRRTLCLFWHFYCPPPIAVLFFDRGKMLVKDVLMGLFSTFMGIYVSVQCDAAMAVKEKGEGHRHVRKRTVPNSRTLFFISLSC